MSSAYVSRNGNHEIAFYRRDENTGERKRHKLRLGKVSIEDRRTIQMHVDELIKCKDMGLPLGADLRNWLVRLGKHIHAQLVVAKLAKPRVEMTLHSLCQHHIDRLEAKSREKSTVNNVRLTGERLMACFGGNKHLRSFSQSDAQVFANWLAVHPDRLAEATRSRTCRRAREIFKTAVEERWLKRNPFTGIQVGVETNAARDCYIPWNEFLRVLEHGKCPRFNLFLVITRTCGIRSPSDVLPLKWSNVDRGLEIMRVQSKKKKRYRPTRDIPIFEELRPYLSAAWVEAPYGVDEIFYDIPMAHKTLCDKLGSMCRKAGIAMWPKPFNNLRASGEHDMWRTLRFDVVAAVLDHTPETAMRHYNRAMSAIRADAEGRVTAFPNFGF